MSKSIGKFFSSLYSAGAVKRTIVVWLLLQSVLWIFFAAGYLAKPGSWDNVQAVAPSSAAVGGVATTVGYIVALHRAVTDRGRELVVVSFCNPSVGASCSRAAIG